MLKSVVLGIKYGECAVQPKRQALRVVKSGQFFVGIRLDDFDDGTHSSNCFPPGEWKGFVHLALRILTVLLMNRCLIFFFVSVTFVCAYVRARVRMCVCMCLRLCTCAHVCVYARGTTSTLTISLELKCRFLGIICRRLVLSAAMVVRLFMNFDVILLYLGCFVFLMNLYNRSDLFRKKKMKKK